METDLHIYEASLLPGGANNPHTIAHAQTGDSDADEPGFFDTVLDIVNPLQHLPVISDIYRELTGDSLAPAARLMGGALFGGPIGFASSLVNAVIEQDSGRDIGGHAMAMLGIGGDDPTPYTAQTATDGQPAVAAAATAPPAPAAGDRALPLSKTDRQTQAMRLAREEREAAKAAAHEGADTSAREAALQTTAEGDGKPAVSDIFWTGERSDPNAAGPVIDLAEAGETTVLREPPDADAGQAPATPPAAADQAASAAPPIAPPPVEASPIAASPIAAAPQNRQAANAAWLAAAFEDARSQRNANQTGAPAERPEAQPWVASAMSAALDKYEAMARQRAAEPTTSVSR